MACAIANIRHSSKTPRETHPARPSIMKPSLALRCFLVVSSSTLLAAPFLHAATLTWDANGNTAAQTDGAGAWDTATQLKWWTGSTNVDWTSGNDAVFGWAGAGGAVTLASPTTVNSLTFKYFTGTYTLGTAGQAITLNNGITKIGGQVGTVTINSPLILAGAQTWTNNSINPINLGGATTLNGNLTLDGDGIINSTAAAAAIGGSGKIIKNGTGQFNFSAGGTTPTHTFTGDIVVNGGSIGYQNSAVLTGRNVHLTDGYLGGRYGSGFTWSDGLGEGANQIRITGGTSGLSGEGSVGSTFQIGTAGSTLIWGDSGEGSATGFFNPDVLLLNGNHRMNSNGVGSLNNAIDLNGATRTITSTHVTNGASTSGFTVNGAITTSSGTAGLIKTGTGNLILAANNTYNGVTTIQSDNAYSGAAPYLVTAPGSITLSGNGRISNTSGLNLTGGGTLRMVSTNVQNTVDRINSAAITVSGGGGLWWENAVGTNSFAETVGSVTVNSGLFNVNLTTNQTAAGDQTLTLGTLTRNGTSSLAFSAGVTGPQTSGNKNMIVVTGAGTTSPSQIVGAWATTGISPISQTDYAIYSSDYVTSLGAAANNDETTWTSANNINFNAATTLTTTRTVNTLRYSGAAATLDLGSNVLETTGLLNGGTGLLTVSGTGGITTPTGGGSLYITTGSNVITVANPITDNGGNVTLVKSGTATVTTDNGNIDTQGTLVLNGVNTYTGDTIINGGTLRIGSNNVGNGAKLGGAGGDYAGNIQINGGGLLYISTNAAQTLSGDISGDGALLKSYNGTLTLSGDNTYTGKTSIAPSTTGGAGTLEVYSFNSVNGGTPLLASSSLGAPTTVANGTIDLGGPGNVQGGATLRYIGTNPSGETTDRVVNIQLGANTSRTIDASGSGRLKFTSPFTSVGGTVATTTIQLIGTGDGEITQGLPFGFFNLTKSGSGTWTLGGAVESSGILTVSANGGTLALQKKSSLMGGVETYWTAPKVIVNSGGTLALNVGGTDQFNNTDVTTVLTNLGGLGGAINNNGLRAGSIIGFDTTNASGGTFTIADNIANSTGTGGGAIGLTKRGAGTLELTGTNTYTGPTTVSAGTLVITGSTSSTSLVTVAAAGTIEGIGNVKGNTALNGTLSPGQSPGTLTFEGNLAVNNAANYLFEGGDLTNVLGELDLNDNWKLTLGLGLQDGGSVMIFDYGTLAASPDLVPTFDIAGLGFTPSTSLSLTDTGSAIVLNGVSVIPEPRAALLGGLGLLMLLRRRR
jgi:autotransporter-associated beta strand protein